MNVLDLFSGIGGFSLGLHRAGFKTVAFCEIDEFCQKVLAKNFPNVPIHSDIKTLTKDSFNEKIDVITGGFPCQPFSNAGKKKGRNDDRDLWPEMFRVIKEIKPTWVIGENVAGFLSMEFTRTKVNLESIGYTVQPFIIPACAVGAQHRRDRVWIIAHIDGDRRIKDSSLQTQNENTRPSDLGNGQEKLVANPDSNGLSREANAPKKKNNKRKWENNWWTEASANFGNWWANQSDMGRAVYGFSREVDRYRRQRIKALGNAVVPQIPEIIGRAIMEVENEVV